MSTLKMLLGSHPGESLPVKQLTAQVIRATSTVAFLALSLAACGGGGGAEDTAPPPPAETTLDWDRDNWDQENWG